MMSGAAEIAAFSRSAPNALSFDLEDWFHIVGIPELEDAARWSGFPSILEKYTLEILDDLDAFDVRATFFVLGWIAERFPDVIREVARRGHEIGSHSHMHRQVSEFDRAGFADDLARSIDAIGECTDKKVRGFRAPSFSVVPGCEWVFDELLDAGLDYDASLFPIARAHGGYPCASEPHMQIAPSGRTLFELPMSTMRFAGKQIAFSGGGYLRLLPMSVIRAGFAQAEAEQRPVVVYLHPRDFAADAPLPRMPFHRRFKSRVGVGGARQKFRALLSSYKFETCAAIVDSAAQIGTPRRAS